MRLTILLFLSLLPLVITGQSARDTLHLKDGRFSSLDLTPYLALYTDPGGDQTIADILSDEPAFVSDFTSDQRTPFPAAHWLRINLLAGDDIENLWLYFKNSREEYANLGYLSYVDAFYVRAGEVKSHYRTGYFVPRREKAVQERAAVNVLPFALPAGAPTTLYLRLSSALPAKTMHIEPVLTKPAPNISYTSDRYKWNVYGSQAMYLIIGFYVLVFWFFVRHRSYLYFGLFCLFFSMHYFDIGPPYSMTDLFFPNRPHLVPFVFTFFASGSTIFLLLFGRSFSEVKGRLPGWDKYFLVVIGLYALFFLTESFGSASEPFGRYPVSFFIGIVLVLPISTKFILGRHRLAKIFGAGILWYFFWSLVGILREVGVLPFDFFVIPWSVGQIGLLMIYALGLGYKIMENERQKSQAERIRELDAVKSRFFANISHEFRTPLSLILGPVTQAMESIPASEKIGDTDDIPVRGRHLKVVKRNALRLQNLVDQILDLSKLDQGKMRLQITEGNLIRFVRSIVFSFESLAERRHIHFQTSFPPETRTAWYDPDKLEKILTNLLSNAFKFTPEHGAIRVQVADRDGWLKIRVTDSGPGLSVEEVEKVFDRFYQVEGTESQGTGIGLALVRELVDLHGGQISVDNVEEEGTTFKITLPTRRDQYGTEVTLAPDTDLLTTPGRVLPSELTPGDPLEKEEDAGVPGQPLVLVVEDSPDLRNYIQENLRETYQLLTADNGRQGLELAVERVPDIVISDVMMPEMDGFDLCATLKTDPRTSHIPVILLTAKAGHEHKLTGLEQGADAYLTKPFDVRELRVRTAKLIEQREHLRERFRGELTIRPTQVTLSSVDERFVREVMEKVETNMGNEFFTVEDLARAVGFSRSQLNRKVKALTGKTSNQLIREFRLTRAKEMLEQNSASVSEVAYEVGYSNLSYFSKSYKEVFGILPSETRGK